MEKFAVGSIVLVSFPFSNLQGKKIRPALVLANSEFDNVILCQITSKPYSSKTAIRLEASDFIQGTLPVVSYIRPDKLFTADRTIITGKAGVLHKKKTQTILQKVSSIFSKGHS